MFSPTETISSVCLHGYLHPLYIHTNMSVLLCLPTPGGSPLGEHLFPSSVPTACSTGPWGQHCWGFTMNTFLLRREEMGMCSILQVEHSLLFWRAVASVNPLLSCPVQNWGCFGAQLTEEHLVPGNSAEFRHEPEPNFRVLSRSRISIFAQYSCS